jgi:hypothetical protein
MTADENEPATTSRVGIFPLLIQTAALPRWKPVEAAQLKELLKS